jgi:GAF domain-containing protein
VLAGADGGMRHAAEAVTHGAAQIGDGFVSALLESPAAQEMQRDCDIVVHDDVERAGDAAPRVLIDRFGVRAQILTPLMDADRLAGCIAVQHVGGPRHWATSDLEAVRVAQARVLTAVRERAQSALSATKEDLRDAALQAILDCLRQTLRVGRCTLRQNVNAAYAFPVTHESHGEGVRSLRGDFTIVQSGQPVIEKLLRERAQVVQNDTRSASADSLFHKMLGHYGDMRAQIVTPLFREDSLAAVLSIHSLKELRAWTPEETALGRSAARMLGLLIGATLA